MPALSTPNLKYLFFQVESWPLLSFDAIADHIEQGAIYTMKKPYNLTLLIVILFSYWPINASGAARKSKPSVDSQSNNLILLIDELNCESITDDKISAFTAILVRAIQEQTASIIVSKNILHNYVARRSFTNHPKHTENKTLVDSPFYKGVWRVFKITGSAYYLLIPCAYLVRKVAALEDSPKIPCPPLGFHFHMTQELSWMLPTTGDFYRDLRTFLRDDRDSATLGLIDLSQIFITQASTIKSFSCPWIIYMGGHGAPKTSTVGTCIATIQKLLEFFDTSITTKIVYINSCFLGGPIKEMLIPSRKKSYKFTLAIGSITDSIVVVHSSAMLFKNFFSELTALPTPSTEDLLAHACSHLAPCIESSWSSHGVSSLPQILIGKHFKVLDPHGTVAILERRSPSPKTLYASAATEPSPFTLSMDDDKEEELPIHPENKIVVALYRSKYPEPIHISPALCVTKYLAQETPLSFIPTTGTLLCAELFSKPKKILSFFGPTTPLLTPFLDDDNTAEQNYTSATKHLSPTEALFPLFVSMLHEPSCAATAGTLHHFSTIVALNEIEDIETPFFGLLRFFRDAFLDASHRASKNVFLIDSLTGFNDFPLFAKLFRHTNKESFYRGNATFFAHDGEIITLENVMVITQGRLGSLGKAMSISINFTFEGFSWHFDFYGTPQEFSLRNPWIFINKAITPYADHYNRCTRIPMTDFKYTPPTYASILMAKKA